MNKRTINEINEKIDKGEANIFTAQEIKDFARSNEVPSFKDVDVVTCGTCGIMSGTAAIFHINSFKPGLFKKPKNIYLNGVPGFVGPCPNEWLGSIDFIMYGTSHSLSDPEYGGGFLFKDILKGEEISIDLESTNGEKFSSSITIDDIPRAEMIGTRMGFKNYTSFTNPSKNPVSSIFNAIEMEGNLNSFSFSGCGEINPLQNDPNMDVITYGSKVLLNGSIGLILGNGTRSSGLKPNLMLAADMREMDFNYLGGFKTAEGPEVFDSVAIPIPVLNQEVLDNLLVLNKDITLPVADIKGRHLPLSETNYENVWDGYDERPKYNKAECIHCTSCLVEERCPTFAFKNYDLDNEKCFGCGICAYSCVGNAFSMNTGSVSIDINNNFHDIHINCRQSDLKRAKNLIVKLKEMIENKEFKL